MNDWVADWDDVLHRSGYSRYRSRRAAAVVAVGALVVVLMLPGIGIGGGLNAWVSSPRPPGLALQAALIGKDGPVAVVTIRMSRLFVAFAPPVRIKPFIPRGKSPFRWSIQVAPGTSVTSARIVDHTGRVLAKLCSTCRNGAHGTISFRRRTLAAIFGRGRVVAETNHGPVHGEIGLVGPAKKYFRR